MHAAALVPGRQEMGRWTIEREKPWARHFDLGPWATNTFISVFIQEYYLLQTAFLSLPLRFRTALEIQSLLRNTRFLALDSALANTNGADLTLHQCQGSTST
jgi:hypothetical protein